MKPCNCHPPVRPSSGPSQMTGSVLYPDVAPRPFPVPPCPPRPHMPVPEPCHVASSVKDIEIVGYGDITVEKHEGVYTDQYVVRYDGLDARYDLVPYPADYLVQLFDSIDAGE